MDGKGNAASLGFIVEATLGINGSRSLLYSGALSVRLIMKVCGASYLCYVKSSCLLNLVVVTIVVLYHLILCMWEMSVEFLSKSILEWGGEEECS